MSLTFIEFVTCIDETDYWWGWYILPHVAYFIFSTGIFLFIFQNANAVRRGRVFGVIPGILWLISYLFAELLGTPRNVPYIQCIPAFYIKSIWILAPELVIFFASLWMELLYGVIFIEEIYTHMPIFRKCVIIAWSLVSVFGVYTYVITWIQLFVSFAFSLITVPLFWLIHMMYTNKYGDGYDEYMYWQRIFNQYHITQRIPFE